MTIFNQPGEDKISSIRVILLSCVVLLISMVLAVFVIITISDLAFAEYKGLLEFTLNVFQWSIPFYAVNRAKDFLNVKTKLD